MYGLEDCINVDQPPSLNSERASRPQKPAEHARSNRMVLFSLCDVPVPAICRPAVNARPPTALRPKPSPPQPTHQLLITIITNNYVSLSEHHPPIRSHVAPLCFASVCLCRQFSAAIIVRTSGSKRRRRRAVAASSRWINGNPSTTIMLLHRITDTACKYYSKLYIMVDNHVYMHTPNLTLVLLECNP